MGRAPCCDKANVKKGPWSPEEDAKLKEYIDKNGTGGNWIALPQKVGLRRCGKSCRLRWLNYLRPNIKHGEFSEEEDRVICSLFASIGSRWSIIAAQLPGRTDNDIKNYWNTKLKKKLMEMSQKRPHQATTYNNPLSYSNNLFFQNSSIPTAYTNCYNTSPIKPFSRAYEPIIPAFSTLISSNSSGFVGPFDGTYNQLNQDCTNTSCSSSDGSCSTSTQQLIAKEIEPDYRLFNGDFQSYFTNGVDENNQKLQVANGCFSENPLDYSIEEIKQLISSNNNLNFFVDEIKTEEKLLDY